MVKALVYLKGGIGDVYSCLAMLPQVMKEKGLKKEDLKVFMDSVYFLYPDVYSHVLKDSMIELMKIGGIDEYEIIPEEFSSSIDLDWPNKEAQRDSPKIGINFDKHDFLFWRFQRTKEFMKKQLEKYGNYILIDDVKTEFIFEWSNGEYKELNQERVPLSIEPDKEKKEFFDSICTGKHILIHIRVKGKAESIADFDRIIKHCKNKGIKCILFGLVKEGYIEPSDNIIDLRNSDHEEKISFTNQLYLSGKAKLMLTSSSGYTYHRLYYKFKDKGTIACFSKRLGNHVSYFSKSILGNPSHIFLNADVDNVDRIMEEIDKFSGGLKC